MAQIWFHEASVSHAEFNRDGRRVVTASTDQTARVWDSLTGQPLTPPLPHPGKVEKAVFSPDGQRVATRCNDGRARIWSVRTGEPLTPPMLHREKASLQCLAFSPDGSRLATSDDISARLWNAETGDPIGVPMHHHDRVLRLAFSPDGELIFTASLDRTVRLWNAATGEPTGVVLNHSLGVSYAAFSPDGRRIVTACLDHAAYVWDAITGLPLGPPLRHSAGLDHVEFSPDGTHVVSAPSEATARVWEVATSQPVTPPLQHSETIRRASFSPDGRWVVTASEDHTARVWDAATGALLFPPLWHGNVVVTASGDNTAQIWNPATGTSLAPALQHRRFVECALFSPDDRHVATASDDHTARIWNALTGEAATPPLQHTRDVNRILFSPDGQRVGTASCDGTARIWNAITGAPVTPPMRHGNWVNKIVFSPDGRRIMTTSDDGTARVWDATTGAPVTAPLRLEGGVEDPGFSRDGKQALANNGYWAQVWDAQTGTPLTPQFNPHAHVADACFSPDESCVLLATGDGRIVSWDITPLDWPLEELAALARLLTSRRIDATGSLVPVDQAVKTPKARTPHPRAPSRQGSADETVSGPDAAVSLRADWQRLRARLDNFGRHTPNRECDWHEQQLAASEAKHGWFAAAFHLDRLCNLRTNDLALSARRDVAHARAAHMGLVPVTGRIPPRPPNTPPNLLDLTAYYNVALTDSMDEPSLDNSLATLAAGVTNLAGAIFDVRGIIRLSSRHPGYESLPDKTKDIHVGSRANRLCFLHATAQTSSDGVQIGSLVVHFANGLQAEVPIVYGRDVRDWWTKPDEPPGGADDTIAWRGTNVPILGVRQSIRLFKTTWTSPLPGVEILTLDYVSKMTTSAPFLIAITVE